MNCPLPGRCNDVLFSFILFFRPALLSLSASLALSLSVSLSLPPLLVVCLSYWFISSPCSFICLSFAYPSVLLCFSLYLSLSFPSSAVPFSFLVYARALSMYHCTTCTKCYVCMYVCIYIHIYECTCKRISLKHTRVYDVIYCIVRLVVSIECRVFSVFNSFHLAKI